MRTNLLIVFALVLLLAIYVLFGITGLDEQLMGAPRRHTYVPPKHTLQKPTPVVVRASPKPSPTTPIPSAPVVPAAPSPTTTPISTPPAAPIKKPPPPVANCFASPGHECADGSNLQIVACPYGSASEGGGYPCEACPKGTYAAADTAAPECVPCAAGTWGLNPRIAHSALCVLCPPGTYCAGEGNAAWTVCPEGTYHDRLGATSVDQCKAVDGYTPGGVREHHPACLASPESFECYLHKRADENKMVVLTMGNFAYLDFVLSWVGLVDEIPLHNYIVIAEDRKLHEALEARGIVHFFAKEMELSDDGQTEHLIMNGMFHQIAAYKWAYTARALQAGFNVFTAELDVAMLLDPTPFLTGDPNMHLEVGYDYWCPGRGEDPKMSNAGVYYVKSVPESISVMTECAVSMDLYPSVWDQDLFHNSLINAFRSNMNWRQWPLQSLAFPIGPLYFELEAPQRAGKPAVMVHSAHVIGHDRKRFNFRENLLWRGDNITERYLQGRKYLTFKATPKIGPAEIRRQMQIGMAMAMALDRTYIMPEFDCGDQIRRCTFQHYFDASAFEPQFPNSRENSMLTNPRIPSSALTPRVDLHIVRTDGIFREGTWQTTSQNDSYVQVEVGNRSVTEARWLSLLQDSKLKEAQLLYFDSVADVDWGGFQDEELQTQFVGKCEKAFRLPPSTSAVFYHANIYDKDGYERRVCP